MKFPRFTLGRWLLLAAVAVLGWSPPAVAQVAGFDLWEEINEQQAAGRLPAALKSTATREIVPQAYRTLTLNKSSMAQLLAAAPAESPDRSPDDGSEIILPLPQGGYGRFSVLSSPIMEPALAAQFPEIKSYIVQGINDPTATGRLDTSPKGFRAMVIGAGGTFFIDPYWSNGDDVSICYAKKDFTNEDKLKEWSCGVVGGGSEVAKSARSEKNAARPTGATLRIYRAAIAATGEYTAFHGGTQAQALAAINTTLNRVNTIYERDFCLRMVLVGNNNLIVYTNAGSDPYTNGDTDLMIDQNQANIDSVIGNANYDIGHVFGTNSGGLAGLGVVCRTGVKAEGVTGSEAPVGDPFDIDYVAHEMGHQFNAEHTFNASAEPQRNATTAFEPGSGSTIMSYAGIVDGQNLQEFANDYFHTGSYTEIDSYITTGAGRFPFSTNATGNSPPVIGSLTNYTIPARTPFALTASATDANGDTLTYCWEEYDLGAVQNPVTANPRDNGASPIFRSYSGTTNPTRLFPSLRYILNNTNVPPTTYSSNSATWATGEAIPTTSRTMTYRVSVRDNRAGGGGQQWASTQVTTVSNAGPFRISSQNSAATLTPGTPFNVTWDVAGTTAAPVSTANVKVSLSTNGGTNFPITLAESVPNNGSASVTIPGGTTASAARLKVEAVGNIFFDINDANLTVSSSDAPIGIPLAAGQSYTQNFDIGSSATATLPSPWRVDKSATERFVGSYSTALTATERAGGANLSSTASNGIYNFGTGETGRAVGGLSSGTASKSVNLYTAISNSGPTAIDSFRISYDVQRFRNGMNPSGFRVQLFYSSDGVSWTSAGGSFLASFAANADNNGAATVPIETIPISNQVLNVPLAAGQTLYLAWSYSVNSGSTTSSSQALGVANVSVTASGDAPTTPTITSFSPPSGPVGTVVTINGANFGVSPVVKFSGVPATTPSVNPGGTVITATVPVGATTGRITVEVSGQPLATSANDFTVGAAVPTITATPATLPSFTTSQGTASTPQSFNVSASNLTAGNLTVTAPTGFEVSLAVGGSYGPTATLAPASGTLALTPVFVRIAASTPQGNLASRDVTIAGGGASTQTVSVSGSVTGGGGGGDGLVAGWDFQTTTTGGTAVAASPNTPKVFVANFGSGTLYADGLNGSSDWAQATELNAFGGTAINATDGLSTVTTSPAALALVNQTANGKRAVFRFSMVGYQNLSVSLAAQRTSTGFTEQVWEYSSDGTIWSPLATVVGGTGPGTIRDSFANTGILTLPATAGLDNAANAYVRVTFNGATAASGNNRIDNIKFTAEQASGPRINVTPTSITTLSAASGTAGVGLPFSVSGQELTGNLTVAAPTNFEVSTTSATTGFGPTATITASGTLAATEVWVRIASSATQGPIGPVNVRITGGGAAERTVAVSGNVTEPVGPVITMTPPALTGFDTPQGVPSANQTVTVSGSNLSGDIFLSAPNGYEISTNGTNFTSLLTLPSVGGVPVVTTLASDSATNSAYAGGWTNGVNGGSGFGPWSIAANSGTGFAGVFIGNPTNAAIATNASFGAVAFGMFANPGGSGAFANTDRTFAPLQTGQTFSFQWAINWDSDVGNKGFTLYAGGPSGTQVLNVNQGGFPGDIRFVSGGVTNTNIGLAFSNQAMRWSFAMTSSTNLFVTSTPRNGETNIAFSTNITVASAPDSFRWYVSAMGAGDQRQPYFNNLQVQETTFTGGAVAPTAVYVRIAATAPQGALSGSLSATTSGSTQPVQVQLSGNVSAPIDAYDIWATSYGLSGPDGARSADPDRDGFSNEDEYAFGTDPTTPTASLLEYQFDQGLKIFFLARAGVLYRLESTGDLVAEPWVPDSSAAVATVASGVPPYELRRIAIDLSKAGSKRFYRVAATVPVGGALLVAPSQLPKFDTFLGEPSASLAFQFAAANLGDSSVTILPPPQFEISTNGSNFTGSPIVFLAAQLSNVPPSIRVRASGEQEGFFTNQVRLTSSGSGPAFTNSVAVSAEVVREPVIETYDVEALPKFYAAAGTPSLPESFTVGALNLLGNLQVKAPAGFAVSTNNSTFVSGLTLTPTGGTIADTTLFVRLQPNAAGDFTGAIQLESFRAETRLVQLEGRASASGAPALGVTGTNSLVEFLTIVNQPSAPQRFGVGGSGLTGNVTLQAPSGFALSLSEGGSYTTNALSLAPGAGGLLNETSVYLRLTGAVTGVWQGLVAASQGSAAQSFGVRGEVFPVPVINVDSQLSPYGFETYVPSPSAPQQLAVSGVNLLSDLVVTAPAGFEVSKDGSIFGPSLMLSPDDEGRLPSTLVLVRLVGTAEGAFSGSLTFTSLFAQGQSFLLSGDVGPTPLVLLETQTVADAGNPAYASPVGTFGKVDYPYDIGKFEITLAEYAEFLNAVAAEPADRDYIQALFNPGMSSTTRIAGISRSGSGTTADPYVYAVVGAGDRPVTFINWFMAARFANWLSNGGQKGSDTEDGAYRLIGVRSGAPPGRNRLNPNTGRPPLWFLPTENEWVKAAYYDPTRNNGSGGYWLYPTRTDSAPARALPPRTGLAAANYNNVTSASPSGLTAVGAYVSSASYYGTFDQAGNVAEWNDLTGDKSDGNRGVRGGNWTLETIAVTLSVNQRNAVAATLASESIGFRLVRGSVGSAGADARFFINVAGAPVLVERYGTGKRGLIFFSNSGDMAADIRNVAGFPFTTTLTQGDYSMFLWSYPSSVPPFDEVGDKIFEWFGDPSVRLEFPGVAKSVVDQIRAANGDLTSVCLVGNSLGAGILLQGYTELVTDPTVRFVLVAPTEVFLPPLSSLPLLPQLLRRTVVASDPTRDFFFATPADIAYIAANSPQGYWPPGYKPGDYPHWIIPFEAPMLPYVFSLVATAYQLPP